MKRALLLLCTLLFLLVGCEKVLEIDEPTERQLVLNGVPQAGRQAFVHFAYTRFFLDDNIDQPVGDVSMTLTVNGAPMTCSQVSNSKYFFPYVLQEDDSLAIDIMADGHAVHAETYVPKYPKVEQFRAMPFASTSFNFVIASFNLDDHAGVDEYYNIIVQQRDSGARFDEWKGVLDTVDTLYRTYFMCPYNEDITASDVCAYLPLGGYLYSGLLFLDKRIGGRNYPVSLFIMQLVDTNEVAPFKHEYTVTVESVTPARFRYLISAGSQNSMFSYFAEQGQVYSNVDGALGIFAGSAKRKYTFSPDTMQFVPAPIKDGEMKKLLKDKNILSVSRKVVSLQSDLWGKKPPIIGESN